MQVNFKGPLKGKNTGSSMKLANYLEKENANKIESEQEYFFSANSDKCNKWEVINQIDNNAKGQGLKDSQEKFFALTIAPSQKELAYIGNDNDKLKEYTREVMQRYAEGFGKGLNSEDLVWYAKLENQRHYSHEDKEVKQGLRQVGELKEGDQRHVQLIISRCTKREDAHIIDDDYAHKQRTLKVSPLTNQKEVDNNKGAVQSGFNRVAFFNDAEKIFDQKFGYERELSQRFEYLNEKNPDIKQAMERDFYEMGREIGRDREPERERSADKSKGLDYDDFGY